MNPEGRLEMITVYLRLIRRTLYLCFFLPVIVMACSQRLNNKGLTIEFLIHLGVWFSVAVVRSIGFRYITKRLEPLIDGLSYETGKFLDQISERWLPWAIVLSAISSLALELAIIRWQGTVWEIFAFYKNFSLLACFAGLGLGYALSKHQHVPAVTILPLLAIQMLTLIGIRHGINAEYYLSLLATPIREQLNMGFHNAGSLSHFFAIYFFLTTVMLLTALAFLPVGQICGRLLERAPQLQAYSLNLIGSIAGTVLMIALSFLWTPPLIWFMPCFAILLLLQSFNRKVLLIGMLTAFIITVILNWPVSFLSERIYSPYQLLERGLGQHGLMQIQAAGHYYQQVHDLSAAAVSGSKERRHVADYYELPYRLHPDARRIPGDLCEAPQRRR
jgi:hypothetical protein